MATCKIQWIDAQGNPTPDHNPAIGHAWTVARWLSGPNIINGAVRLEESEHFPICAEHAKRFRDKGMDIWAFQALDAPSLT